MQVVLATQNCHKIRELRLYFSKLKSCDFFSLIDFPSYKPGKETGQTFEEIAVAKACKAAKALGKWALADDSGLVVPALKGAPGIFSARYAGEKATDKENRHKLLKEMRALEGVGRYAYFICCLALSRPDGSLARVVSALCEGSIIDHEKGGGGFGYDCLFVKHDYNHTFAELSESVKNRISHRAKAASKMLLYLEGESVR